MNVINEKVYKGYKINFEVELNNVYEYIYAYIENERISYKRNIIVSSLKQESYIILNELGVLFEETEMWKIYLKFNENLMWYPYIKVGEVLEESKYVQFVQDVDVYKNEWKNVVLNDFQYGSFEFSIYQNQCLDESVYFLIIECDGLEKEINNLEHKIFICGKSNSELVQAISFQENGIKNISKEHTIWVIGYIKQGTFHKLDKFVSRREVENNLTL
ncbi:hypothetical protein IMG5_056740 [Ichthyophthirius multifiliis]|uniref:Uncharacterized protein n=1 Tax=Ichthyophthirius multifiliis TaxID=5932 RepID=G0QNA3_ICHMU|nr:hypothetical protein IMG5_056740 [Ichthyophthirius multifiliis]EGR33295.1 hypothetical protein IMG5_056740 [Ichthyophthirius multifiliis]|eukprot:XP_004037281.1 hypothetical protein IMG5_056740 [Ichthyophthirius multifiliis]